MKLGLSMGRVYAQPKTDPTRSDGQNSTHHRSEWLIKSSGSDLQWIAVNLIGVGDLKFGQNLANRWYFGDILDRFGEISPDSARSHQIQWDIAKSGGDFMDLAEISPEMAKISPDLKNFARKCSISRFDRVLRVLGRKPANRPAIFGF